MLSQQAVQQGRIAFQVASAIKRATQQQLYQHVEQVQIGVYRVPSQSRAGLAHTVQVRRRRYSAEPLWACYACSCEAGRRAACVHRAAVWQWITLEHRGALPVAVNQQALGGQGAEFSRGKVFGERSNGRERV